LGNGVLEDQAQPGGPPTTRTDVGLEDRKGRESAGEGLGPQGRGKAQPPKQQIEAIIQTSVYHLNRGRKQKPANPRPKETKINK
jgi:hypothetical protein